MQVIARPEKTTPIYDYAGLYGNCPIKNDNECINKNESTDSKNSRTMTPSSPASDKLVSGPESPKTSTIAEPNLQASDCKSQQDNVRKAEDNSHEPSGRQGAISAEEMYRQSQLKHLQQLQQQHANISRPPLVKQSQVDEPGDEIVTVNDIMRRNKLGGTYSEVSTAVKLSCISSTKSERSSVPSNVPLRSLSQPSQQEYQTSPILRSLSQQPQSAQSVISKPQPALYPSQPPLCLPTTPSRVQGIPVNVSNKIKPYQLTETAVSPLSAVVTLRKNSSFHGHVSIDEYFIKHVH